MGGIDKMNSLSAPARDIKRVAHRNDRTSCTCRLAPRHRLSREQRASRIGKICASLSGEAIMIGDRRP